MSTFENWGDYFWPGQLDECMRNRLSIHDPEELRAVERDKVYARTLQLVSGEAAIEQTLDLAHVQAIHAHLFGDVYEWAGQLRVTDLVRPDADPNKEAHAFLPPEAIAPSAQRLFDLLDPAGLVDLERAEQVERLAALCNGLNMVHPFVEGNGRTNRMFLADVAAAADLAIDWSRFGAGRDQNAVMKEAFEVGPAPVREALAQCLVDRDTAGPAGFAAAQATVFAVASTEDLEAAKARSRLQAIQAAMRPNPSSPSRQPGSSSIVAPVERSVSSLPRGSARRPSRDPDRGLGTGC